MHLGTLRNGRWAAFAFLACALVLLPLTGCGSGSDGQDGRPGQPGASTGMLRGMVTNAMTDEGLAGVEVEITPDVTANPVMTAADGSYSVELPVGIYEVACEPDDFVAGGGNANILADVDTTMDMSLDPVTPVKVTIVQNTQAALPGMPVDLAAVVEVFDDSTPMMTYMWTQTMSVEADIDPDDEQTTTVTLGPLEDYKDAILHGLVDLDRWRVQPINPHAQLHGAAIEVTCEVTTSTGTYKDTHEISATLPFGDWAGGIRNVPIGKSVMLDGKDQVSYDWDITEFPGDTAPPLFDDETENPYFTPMEVGLYTIRVVDLTTPGIPTEEIEIHAGEWTGCITDEEMPPSPSYPVMDPACIGCHGGSEDWNDAVADWRRSGHAHIFSVNINAGGHYSSACFDCHTVGYQNGGIDAQDDYQDFLDHVFPGGHIHGDPGNWTWMLENTPDTARFGNIQCENCHGPNGPTTGPAHQDREMRNSLMSDVCAYCHGEPPRHARFQQWEESGHGNYETAIAESNSTSCAKCHTAQGFMQWYEDGSVEVAPGPDNAHPITCSVCHFTHFVGTSSGHGTDAGMRITTDTRLLGPSTNGWYAYEVGKGAMCITCHESRRGVCNDLVGLARPDRPDYAPHVGPQGDVLMGMNAFYVDFGIRGSHGFLEDTCVTCHVELTPPPAELSYNLGGTNHTFEAKTSVCNECHTALNGEVLIENFHHLLGEPGDNGQDSLHGILVAGLNVEIAAILDHLGHTIEITGAEVIDDEEVEKTATLDDETVWLVVALAEFHGRSSMDILVDGELIPNVQLGSGGTSILNALDNPIGSLVDNTLLTTNPDDVAKTNWNYWLLHSDGSGSAHNPSWCNAILTNTAKRAFQIWNLDEPDDT